MWTPDVKQFTVNGGSAEATQVGVSIEVTGFQPDAQPELWLFEDKPQLDEQAEPRFREPAPRIEIGPATTRISAVFGLQPKDHGKTYFVAVGLRDASGIGARGGSFLLP